MPSCPGNRAGISAMIPKFLVVLLHFFPQLVRSHRAPTVAFAAVANVRCN